MKTHFYIKELLPIFLLLFSIPSWAQDSYFSHFPDSNVVWYFTYHSQSVASAPTIMHYTVELSEDTIISEISYQKLFTTEMRQTSPKLSSYIVMQYQGAIREDSMQNKVYFVRPNEEEEKLLYDFNWEVGDTVIGQLATSYPPNDTIVNIDSVLVGANYRKRWQINSGYGIYLIDGIGSTNGLINSSPGYMLDASSTILDCFQQEGKTLYPDINQVCELPIGVFEFYDDQSEINIYPNPSSGSISVEFGDNRISRVIIFDIFGKIVFKKDTYGEKNVGFTNLKSGIYILQCTDSESRIFSRKIVCGQ